MGIFNKKYIPNWTKFLVLIGLTALNVSQTLPEKPKEAQYVNDYAKIFTYEESQNLEYVLRSYFDTTSTQIVVVTVPSLEGADISDYAIKLGLKWGVGISDKDNGVVFVIAPNERKMFIATGYGVEEKLTDVFLTRLRENYILPYFKNQDYYSGVNIGVQKMIERLSGVYKNDNPSQQEDTELTAGDVIAIFFAIVFIMMILSMITRGLNYGETYSGKRYRSGPFGGFGGGLGGGLGGGFGGFGGGGGGFGGGSFGGGSFGGGGSGGGW